MKNMKSTKRSLFLSAMALLLCTSMLIGTTYAWFTESVSSVNNGGMQLTRSGSRSPRTPMCSWKTPIGNPVIPKWYI